MEQLVAGDALVAGEELTDQNHPANVADGRRLRLEELGVVGGDDEDPVVVLRVSTFRASRRSVDQTLEVGSKFLQLFFRFDLNVEAVGWKGTPVRVQRPNKNHETLMN